MSDIRFNQWLHNSGTGGVSQVDGGHVGIGTTNPLIPVGSGNTAILNVGVVTANSFYGSGANLTSLPAQATIANNADNRVITGGSGVNLNGESGFTFNGSLASIINSSGPTLELTTNTNAADASLRLHEGTTGSTSNGGGMFYSGADNKLHITCGTNLTTKRITISRDTGNVGIGTDQFYDGTSKLEVRGRINTVGSASTGSINTGNGTVVNVGSLTPHNLQVITGNNTRMTIENGTGEALRITSGGIVIINQTSASGTKLAIQSTASSGSGTATGIRVGNNIGVLSQYPANLEVRTTGVATYNAIRTDAGDGNGGFTCGVESYNGFLDLTTGGSNDIKVKLRSNGVSYLNGGKVVIGSAETSTGLLLLDKNLSASSDVSDKNNYHLVIRSQTNENPSKIGIAFANTTDDTHVGAAIIHERESTDSIGSLLFYTSPSSGTTTERMKIDRYGNVTKPNHCAFKSSMTGSYGGVGSLTTTVANVGILLAGEVYDRGDHYNTTSKLFTCPVDGVYMVNVFVSLGNVGSNRHIFVIAYTNGGGSTPLQNYFECIDGNTSSYANYSYCEPWYFTQGTTIGVGKNGHSGSNVNYQMSWGVHLLS